MYIEWENLKKILTGIFQVLINTSHNLSPLEQLYSNENIMAQICLVRLVLFLFLISPFPPTHTSSKQCIYRPNQQPLHAWSAYDFQWEFCFRNICGIRSLELNLNCCSDSLM